MIKSADPKYGDPVKYYRSRRFNGKHWHRATFCCRMVRRPDYFRLRTECGSLLTILDTLVEKIHKPRTMKE